MAACCFRSLLLSLGPLATRRLQPEGAVGAEQTVADLRIGQRFQALFASLELLQVKADVLLTTLEFLGAEELDWPSWLPLRYPRRCGASGASRTPTRWGTSGGR